MLASLLVLGLPGPAAAVSPDIVISQVYGGGGNSGATLTHDFIELYNRGAETVSVEGWSVQYASASGSTWVGLTPLHGQIPAGAHYLVQEAQGAGGTTPPPEPDAVGEIPLSSTGGKVALVTNTTSLPCGADCDTASANGVRDFVGYGAANDFETTPTAAPSNTASVLRAADGATDTDNNSADFITGDPNPRSCGAACDPPDTTKPVSRVTRPAQGVTYKRGALLGLRGTASDAGGSGLKKVQVALRRNMRNGSCKWWTGSRWKARGCSRKLFLNANGTATWKKGLGSRLPRSRGTTTRNFTVYSRAIDKANNVESTFKKGRNANTFEVR